MIKVTYFDINDTYLDHTQRFYTKYFKRKILAIIFIIICRFLHDYIDVEELDKGSDKE